ncbi:MAG: murein biosynthesis integral membrane protein MurJ [Planctomycetes bacterium]|nr:murein biosynthesis integral membrane protein MurJ [Planctomycetota bacterium]
MNDTEKEQDGPAGNSSVARSTWGVSALTMSSRLLGLVRDYCLVAVFGAAAWVTDAFVLAFTIPNLFRRLFGEGALAAAFIPVFVKAHETEGKPAASKLASTVLTLLLFVTGAIAALGIAACLGGGAVFATSEKIILSLKLGAVMLPFLCLICCSALLSGILQSLRIFAIPAMMSIVLNLCFLASFAYIHYNSAGGDEAQTIFYVAYAVVVAGLIQVMLQIPVIAMQGITLRPDLGFGDARVSEVLKAMGPTAIGLGVVQVNVLMDNLIAYWISLGTEHGEGASTYLYLGNRLMQLPLGVFGIAVATTVFPFLSSHAAKNEYKQMVERIAKSIRMLLFIILPASAGLIATSIPLVQMIFQKPDMAFSDLAVYRTAAVLACYAIGLAFFSIQHLLTRTFYARGEYSTPVKIAMGMVGVNLALNLILMNAPDLYRRWMGEAFYSRWLLTPDAFPMKECLGEAGLALATTITAVLNVMILWHILKKRMSEKVGAELWEDKIGSLVWSGGRILLASGAMGIFVSLTVNSIPYEPELAARLERGFVPIILGMIGYYVACLIIPVPELQEFLSFRKKKKKPAEDKDL